MYGCLILSFGTGALIGALTTRVVDVRAIWIPTTLIAGTIAMFLVEQRSRAQR